MQGTDVQGPRQLVPPPARPVRKVAAGGTASAFTVVAVWSLAQFGGVQVPGYVASALTTITAFAIAYLVPTPGDRG
jgi:hypothetical protein